MAYYTATDNWNNYLHPLISYSTFPNMSGGIRAEGLYLGRRGMNQENSLINARASLLLGSWVNEET